MVQRFREGKKKQQPGRPENNGGDPKAPPPAKIFRDGPSDHASNMCPVGDKDSVNPHDSATLVHEEHVSHAGRADTHPGRGSDPDEEPGHEDTGPRVRGS